MRAARNAGLDIVALTDHDTTDGWDEARDACAELGMTFVPGIEFSASHNGSIVHLLGYLVDPTEPTFADTCARTRDDRQWRFEKMVDNLHQDFDGMTREFAYSFHVDGATLGRPTIARALVDLGIVATVSEAFDDLLSSSNDRYYAGHYAPTIEDAIAIVRGAGGVPVLAHPWTATRTTLVGDHDTDDQSDGDCDAEVHRDAGVTQVVSNRLPSKLFTGCRPQAGRRLDLSAQFFQRYCRLSFHKHK